MNADYKGFMIRASALKRTHSTYFNLVKYYVDVEQLYLLTLYFITIITFLVQSRISQNRFGD